MMWLLAVALPVQGSVAASLRVCGPGHEERMAVVVQAALHDDLGGHHHVEASVGSADEAYSSIQDFHKHAQHKCSACAACCVTAALPAATLSFEASQASAALPPPFPSGPAVFLTDGPERPPRIQLV